jgi:putative membrane protein
MFTRYGCLGLAFATAMLMSGGCAWFGEQRAAGKPAAMLLITTARSSGAEVSLSRIALTRSSNPEVKRFAQQAMANHQQMIQEMRGLAERRGVSIMPVPDETNQRLCAHLLEVADEELDQEYLWEMIVEHTRMAAKFEPQGQQEKDPEIRRWAARQLPKYHELLKMAQSLHEGLRAARLPALAAGSAFRR